MKKIWSIILAALLLFSFVVPASAEGEARITVAEVSGRFGETVDVAVTIADNPGIAGYTLDLEYNNSNLEPISITKGGATPAEGSFLPNLTPDGSNEKVRAFWYNMSNFTNNGLLFTVQFKIKETATAGITYLNLVYADGGISNSVYATIPVIPTHGKVTILKLAQDAPDSPELDSKSAGSVTLKKPESAGAANVEYRRGSGGDWQTSPEFTGLELYTEYTFYMRLAATPTLEASPASPAARFRTDKGDPVLDTHYTSDLADARTYNRASQAVSITAAEDYEGLLGAATVKYAGTGGTVYTESATAPTNAGSYAVTAAFAAGAKFNAAAPVSLGTMTIAPADYAYPVTATQQIKVGSNLSALAAPTSGTGVGGESVTGTLEWFIDSGRQTAAQNSDVNGPAVGASITLYWRFTASNANYVDTPKEGSTLFTIVEGYPQPLQFALGNSVTKTYGGESFTNAAAHDSSNPPEGSANPDTKGAITYASDDTTVATVNASTGAVTILKAGTATITATAAAIPGSWAQGTASYTLTVSPKSLSGASITLTDGNSYTYTGSAIEPEVAGVTLSGGPAVSASDYDVSYTDDHTNAGQKTVTLTGKDNFTGTATIGYTIAPKSASALTIEAILAQTYTDEAITPELTVKDGATPLYITTDYTVAYTNNTNAGTATATITGAGNYTGTKSADFTINKKEIAVTGATLAAKTYDKTTTGTVSGVTFPDGVSLTLGTDYTAAVVYGDANAGTDKTATVMVTLTGDAADNYTLTSSTFQLTGQTIARAPLTITAATLDADKPYDGTTTATVTDVTLDGVVEGDTLTLNTDYTATAVYNDANAATGSKTATVMVALTGTAANNYTLTSSTYQLTGQTIARAPLTITAATLDAKTYDGTAAGTVASVTLSGVAASDTLTQDTDYTATVAYDSANAATGSKTATVTVTLLNGNYTLDENTFQLTAQTIGKATLTPPANALVYVKQNVETAFTLADLFPLPTGWTYEGTGVVDGEITITESGTDATTRTVTLINPNYNDVVATIDVIVTAKEIVAIAVTDLELDKEYDGAPVTYTGEYEDTFSAESPTDAGDYTLTLTKDEDADNVYTPQTIRFTISPAPLTVTAQSYTQVRGTAFPAYEVETEGFAVGEDWQSAPAISCVATDPNELGAFDIIPHGGTLAKPGNYTITYENGTLTITKNNVATLNTLYLDGGIALTPAFGAGVTSYTASVANSVTSVTVTAAPVDSNAAVTGDGAHALNVGENAITVTVTAEDGTTTKTYTITITRAGTSGGWTSGGGGTTTPTPTPTPDAEEPAQPETPDGAAAPETVTKAPATESGFTVTLTKTKNYTGVTFGDIAPEAWYADIVKFAYEYGLFNGTSATKFSPDGTATRAQIITVLARAAGVDTEGGASWYEKAAAWAKENGISDGTNLDGEVTREQLATLLWRFAGKPTAGDATPGASEFTDADEISDWAREAVAWAVSAGIINGYPDGGFNPSSSATRAEVAAMIKRYIEN